MTKDALLYREDGGVATLTLNRPDKLNAINEEIEDEISRRLGSIKGNDKIRVVVLNGAGRAFCAGADIGGDASIGVNDALKWRNAFMRSHEVLMGIMEFPKPVIASTHGYALGLGFFYAMAADMIISTDECKFGSPEIRHAQSSTGLVPAWNVGRNIMMELLLTGDLIDGKKAEAIGLVNRAVPAGLLEKETYRLARKLALIDSQTLGINKATINSWYGIGKYRESSLFSVDSNTVLNVADTRKKWDRLFREKGLKGFLRERDEPFRKLDEE
ncbi:MAG: enoyl-CoA hydratase/isomerase family protein [Nitrososphaerota archaeon]|jgi:enoyl-CoA hydratase/carnithine racemase|nr:enoyl-CoA hydratase/isomerase family protein [Nitrososphaerota archaeon]MDG6935392.1 enoyl-CoA hydratase/isomerase family protein [Nitrososphaerota archaeon]